MLCFRRGHSPRSLTLGKQRLLVEHIFSLANLLIYDLKISCVLTVCRDLNNLYGISI
jgi:hypothetical protein